MGEKWSFEKLFEEWSTLVLSSRDRYLFAEDRDQLIEKSGWTKREFYTETDKRQTDDILGREKIK